MWDEPFWAGGMQDERKYIGGMRGFKGRREAGGWILSWRDAGIR